MKHPLSGTIFAAALVIAAPVWAQTQPAPYAQPAPPRPAPYAQPAPPQTYAQPAPSYKERRVYRKHHKRHAGHTRMHYGRRSGAPQDNMANQLNAQELARMGGAGPGPGMAGSYRGGYGQPSPTEGMPGAYQPSASSHPPGQMR
jgi:hypothetical protein